MKATIEDLDGNKIKLSIEVEESEFDGAVDDAFKRIAKEVRLPGFRPGKAPRRLLEQRLGTGYARSEALREAMPHYYAQAVLEHDIDVIAPPEIQITNGEDAGAVAFDAVVEIRPEVTVGGYDGIEVSVARLEASDDEIDAQIDRLRRQFADLADVERPAGDGDFVTVDIAGSQDGEPLPGLTADDYLYEVGSSGLVAELDDNLRGAKAGDILEFDATHPTTQSDLRFRILVKDVKERVLPELTDEWVAEASEFASVQELRADIAQRMADVRRGQIATTVREKTAQALAALVDAEIPDSLIDIQVNERLQTLALQLQAQGMNLEQYLSMTGQDQVVFVAELRDNSAVAAKVDLALRAVAGAEGVTVDDGEVHEEIHRMADQLRQDAHELEHRLVHGGQLSELRSDIKKRKALDWLVEHANVVDDDGQPVDRTVLEAALALGKNEPISLDEGAVDGAADAEFEESE